MNSMDIDQLQHLLWTFAQHRVITVAARTGILRRMAEGEGTEEAVAHELNLDPLATGKVMRALTALGLLETRGQTYCMAPALAPHFLPGPGDFGPMVEHHHHMYTMWGENLEPWVRGETWQGGARTGPPARAFGEAMQANGTRVARRLAELLDLSEPRAMLDVGGGFGHYSKALCRKYPELHATVLDRPETAQLGAERASGDDVAPRITFRGGSYWDDDWGEGHDLVLLANVLHQEPPDRARQMVRRAAGALAPGGRVVIVEFIIDDEQRQHVLGALFAINMRSFGDTYPEPTLRRWMQEAGLTHITRTDLSDYRWVFTGRR